MTDETSDRMSLIEMDPLPGEGCKRCGARVVLNAELTCRPCHERSAPRIARQSDAAVPTKKELIAMPRHELDCVVSDLVSISDLSQANASVSGAGSMAGGQLAGVGFTSRDGYITAIRNGVPLHTHASYLQTLRVRYGMTSADLADLPGPMAVTSLPEGAGIVHTPTGTSIFDRPPAERRFIVGPDAPTSKGILETHATTKVASAELVAGATAEGHHAIVAWEGRGAITRGALIVALGEKLAHLAPRAVSAHGQAGVAVTACTRDGLVVRAMRKTSGSTTGVHVWTVGRVDHRSQVGGEYGTVVCRFTLTGEALSYEGDDTIGDPVVDAFNARMSAELYKASDITAWLSAVLRKDFDAVRFGALGWLIPARNVGPARILADIVASTGFGIGWVSGLPVATSDQLRDGIVRGLRDEVAALSARLSDERADAKEAHIAWLGQCGNSAIRGKVPAIDIGSTRAETYLRDFRAVAERVVAYGAILGAERVEGLRVTVRDAMAELEGISGDDFSGIRARFSNIWDEIELDRSKKGGVL